jgi:hypothetical protein
MHNEVILDVICRYAPAGHVHDVHDAGSTSIITIAPVTL